MDFPPPPLPTIQQQLMMLFERPYEPTSFPKGRPRVYVFDIPAIYKTEDTSGEIIPKRRQNQEEMYLPVYLLPGKVPDITFAKSLGRQDQFSLFLPYHRELASRLVAILMSMVELEELKTMVILCRNALNPMLVNYAYSVAILNRPDTKDLNPPSLVEYFPASFVTSGTIERCLGQLAIQNQSETPMPIVIRVDFTGNNMDPEQRLAYFREDLGVNLHHWHWHLVYPFEGAREVVAKNRRGELFYYMHQQVVARYNMERFSNNMPRTASLTNFRKAIPEGYFPKLDTHNSSKNWPSRQENSYLSDTLRETERNEIDIADLERWQERIYEAIHKGSIISSCGQVKLLNETDGINILGDMIEASILSPNPGYYGSFHNKSHLIIASAQDPVFRYNEKMGVMSQAETAMRDPIFYRLHGSIDDMFQEHKLMLPSYTIQQLDFSGVTITEVGIQADGELLGLRLLPTYWEYSDVEISRGLDFSEGDTRVSISFRHLNHDPFRYTIKVVCVGQKRQGTVRIFLAPKYNELGLPWQLSTQRTMFIEMDRFVVDLSPGENIIQRRSNQSSVTLPYTNIFPNLNIDPDMEGEMNEFNACGCGWPAHMLLPKGNADGLQCQLFVMVTDFHGDCVQQLGSTPGQCMEASSFCGIRDAYYPDRRAMGFPFDRKPREGADTLNLFLTPNMRVQEVTILHKNVTMSSKQHF